MVIF